mgnify:CR=1 FL=1
MNILFVTRPITPPWNEGSKNLTWQLVSRLTRHTAYVLTTKGKKRPSSPHASVHWLPIYTQTQLTLWQKMRLLGCLALKPPPVDIFHFYFVPTLFTSRLLSTICRLHGKKSVQTIPSLPAELPPATKMSALIFADQVVVYSDFSLRRLNALSIQNVTRIDAGIEVERWANAQPDSTLRQRLGAAEEAVLILFAGEYARLGSVAVLKHIMPRVINHHPNAHFLIACRILSPADLGIEAKLKQMVQTQQLEQKVHFLGEVADFPALLRASDIFFFPVTEMAGKIDTPLTLLEAMAAGLPILTNDIRPLNEIEGLTDLSLASDNAALLEQLSQLVSSPALRREIGRYGQSRVEQRYGLARMVTAYETLYDSFV